MIFRDWSKYQLMQGLTQIDTQTLNAKVVQVRDIAKIIH